MNVSDDKGQASSGPFTSDVQRYLQRLTFLRNERSSWITHYQELSDYIYPRRFRYLQTDRNKGTKRNDKIVNNKPTIAVRILAAGKMAGMSSPARPWARFTIPDPRRASIPRVQQWLSISEKIFYETMAKSNLYNCLHEVYGIQATFATAAIYVEEDEIDDVRGYVFPTGQYCLASSGKQRIDTIYREFSMTAGQLVKEFGFKKCSPNTQEMFKAGNLDQWVDVVHVVEPNEARNPRYVDNQNMPYKSCWFERTADTSHPPLRVSGFHEFPVMVARWFVTGEDIYGSGSPGMDGLGDCKALQILERRKAQAVDKIVNPPMQAPSSMRTQRISLLPGDTNYVPDGQSGQFKSAIDVHPQAVEVIKEAIHEHENRIGETFYTDLFVMMLNDDRQQPSTAREINERHEEKMLQLGPVVERDEDELFDPLINRVMNILMRKGKVPPPPPELRGQRVKVEYISIMAQAQKLIGTAADERLASFVGSMAAVRPDVLDIINYDELVKEYAKLLGVSPTLINPDDVIDEVRKQRAAKQQAQEQGQAMLAMAQGAKVASDAELDKGSMLDRLMAGASGTAGGPSA